MVGTSGPHQVRLQPRNGRRRTVPATGMSHRGAKCISVTPARVRPLRNRHLVRDDSAGNGHPRSVPRCLSQPRISPRSPRSLMNAATPSCSPRPEKLVGNSYKPRPLIDSPVKFFRHRQERGRLRRYPVAEEVLDGIPARLHARRASSAAHPHLSTIHCPKSAALQFAREEARPVRRELRRAAVSSAPSISRGAYFIVTSSCSGRPLPTLASTPTAR